MSNTFPTSLNNYVGSETLSAAGHAQAHNAYEAKIGTGSSTPTANTYFKGTGTGTSAWAAFSIDLTTDVTGTLPVANGGTGVTASTGTVAVVLSTSPTLVTPILGVATATSINKVAITAPASSATLTIANGKTLTASNTLTLAGTDSTTITFQATDTYVGRATTDTLTNKTINSTTNVIGPSTLLSFNSPQGFLINGKIVPSVASNDLTVAIKGLDGSDPSATNPVYCRIGDSIRSITSALSVTKNDGTNWFDSGGAELATKETDYFVYLGYNATDGVVVGFSRIPYATKYGDFSATSTNAAYCAISTITTAASTDYYQNIGRFAATLSAGAGYTWTVPTFTAINLIQYPIYESRWLAFVPVDTGFSAVPTNVTAKYSLRGAGGTGEMVWWRQGTDGGTSNATTWTQTLPFPALNTTFFPGIAKDNGGGYVISSNVTSAGNKAFTLYPTAALGGNWTSSGVKNAVFWETMTQIA